MSRTQAWSVSYDLEPPLLILLSPSLIHSTLREKLNNSLRIGVLFILSSRVHPFVARVVEGKRACFSPPGYSSWLLFFSGGLFPSGRALSPRERKGGADAAAVDDDDCSSTRKRSRRLRRSVGAPAAAAAACSDRPLVVPLRRISLRKCYSCTLIVDLAARPAACSLAGRPSRPLSTPSRWLLKSPRTPMSPTSSRSDGRTKSAGLPTSIAAILATSKQRPQPLGPRSGKNFPLTLRTVRVGR